MQLPFFHALPPDLVVPFVLVSLFALGACLGSFLNVCIYRIPLGVSIVRPPSSCAACGAPLKAWWNLPIFGWLFLRGRAACCGVAIDRRYPLVELAAALLLPALFWRSPWPVAAVDALFLYALLVASLIDIDHFLIPDRLTLGGIAAGLAASALVPALHGRATAWAGFNAGLGGAFLGGFLLWGVVVIGTKVLKKEAMGLGDVKLLAAIGAFLGWQAVLFVIAVSSILGSLFGLAMMARGGQVWGSRLPYGPFLSLAAALWVFGGGEAAFRAIGWWQHAMGFAPHP